MILIFFYLLNHRKKTGNLYKLGLLREYKMKKEAKNKEDLVYRFWKKYEEADYLEKEKILRPIIKNFMSLYNLKEEKMRKHVLSIALQGYFDDLIEYFYCRKGSGKS